MSSLFHRLRPRVRRALSEIRGALGYTPTVFCFVTGTYRSGTTAMAKWLGSQRGISSFSESRIMVGAHSMMKEVERFRSLYKERQRIHAGLRRMVFEHYEERCHFAGEHILVDKEPLGPIAFPERGYADFLSSVRTLVPETKIVMMVRDPVSTVWSMSQRDYGYSLTTREIRAFPLEEHIANWCAGADVALALMQDPNAYVCSFDKLTTEPHEESHRVAQFLGLRSLEPFQPRQTAAPDFTAGEHSTITTETQGRVEALAAAGCPVL
jgi:hypothetical protein